MTTRNTTDDTVKLVLIVLAAIVLAPVLMVALAVPVFGMWGSMMGGFGGGSVGPMWVFGLSLVWLVVLVGAGYLVYRWAVERDGAEADPALEELRLAYARGDLDDEEFEARRSKLE